MAVSKQRHRLCCVCAASGTRAHARDPERLSHRSYQQERLKREESENAVQAERLSSQAQLLEMEQEARLCTARESPHAPQPERARTPQPERARTPHAQPERALTPHAETSQATPCPHTQERCARPAPGGGKLKCFLHPSAEDPKRILLRHREQFLVAGNSWDSGKFFRALCRWMSKKKRFEGHLAADVRAEA